MKTERLPTDLLARLQLSVVAEHDQRHQRTEFSAEEIAKLVAAARSSPVRCGLSGPARALLYQFASSTGFRATECSSVRKSDFTEGFEFVEIGTAFTKNGKRAQQPIPAALRESIREFVTDLAEDALLWPLAAGAPIDILRADAAVAGVAVGRDAKGADGCVRDFHSFRHYFASELDRRGYSRSIRERLMRAGSGIVEKHYTHRQLSDVAGAVEGLVVPGVIQCGI